MNEEKQADAVVKPKYVFYENILIKSGYKFIEHIRPFDKWHDGKNEILICESCRIIAINGNKILHSGIDRVLIRFLFNN